MSVRNTASHVGVVCAFSSIVHFWCLQECCYVPFVVVLYFHIYTISTVH